VGTARHPADRVCGGQGSGLRDGRNREKTVKEERNFFDTTAQYLDVILMNFYLYVQNLSYGRWRPTAAMDGTDVRSNPWWPESGFCVKFSQLCQVLTQFCRGGCR
jgi:hypothetical protein